MLPSSDSSRYLPGLIRSRTSLLAHLCGLFGGKNTLREEDLGGLEEILLLADVGVEYTTRILEDLRRTPFPAGGWNEEGIRSFLRGWIIRALTPPPERESSMRPEVVLFVGVNGTGKTTTIGKLAARASTEGKKVLLAAGDTYRAAAAEQLAVWAERAGAGFIRGREGADPAAVIHDALQTSSSRGDDLVLVDTAGRLHTKVPLMKELEKIVRVAARVLPGAPHQVLLVLDASIGQNALSQARTFTGSVPVTGLVAAKMDGTAKGGILVPIVCSLGLPVRWVGLGEGIADLVPFDPSDYAAALLG